MKLETFLTHLHDETEKIIPHDWKVNWEDAPLSYKLYRGLPVFPLPAEIQPSFEVRNHSIQPTLTDISYFLWYIYGITQIAQTAYRIGPAEKDVALSQSLRRFVPSGGALYPSEIYLYLKGTEIPEGIYHYSAAHHQLVLIREGNYDSYLSRSLGNSCDISECFAAVFVSTVFWKNFYKYHNFSYRLQGLDAGVVIGQTLEVANRMGFIPKVCFQFLDLPVNHLLGLSEEEESVYAVIPLSVQPLTATNHFEKSQVSEVLCNELSKQRHSFNQRSKKVIDYPMLKKLNEASMYDAVERFGKLDQDKMKMSSTSMETIMLPFAEQISYDLAEVCRERHSPDLDFKLGKVSQLQISTLLKGASTPKYENDLVEANDHVESRLAIYGCLSNVEGIPNGAYYYEKNTHSLIRVSSGDYREYLQLGLLMDNVNMFQVPLCFHIVGDKDHYIGRFGYRGYRIQQMEAGILLQRLLLVSGALGLGGHPLLGFDAKSCDKLYQIVSKEKTSLIQVPVGFYRPRAWLKGNLL